jgi:hypothetical protein
MTSTMAPEERSDPEGQTAVARATTAAADVGAQVRTAAVDAAEIVADHAPAVLAASRGTVERVFADLRGRSDESLALGTVFAAGLCAGMLLARAPRLFVSLAFLTAMLFGGMLVARAATGGETSRRAAHT